MWHLPKLEWLSSVVGTSLANFEVVSIHKISRGGVVKESEPHEMYSNVLMQSHGSHRRMMLI